MRRALDLNPVPECVFLGTGQGLVALRVVRSVVAVHGRGELPERHLVNLLRRPAKDRPVAVIGRELQEVGTSGLAAFSFPSIGSSSEPNKAAARTRVA